MPNRILKESICTSDTIDRLSWFEEVFFYRLIVNCDDYGRMDARPAILKARLFPLKSVTEKQVSAAIQSLKQAGVIATYTHNGRPYLQLLTWDKHQQVRTRKSKYPEPPAEISAPREHDLPLEDDIENLLYEHLSSTMSFNNDELVSVDRQVRVKECYFDIVAKTHDSAYLFEIKRNRLSNKAIEQITNYLKLLDGRGILMGCGLAANFDIAACAEREIAVISYDDNTLEVSAIYIPDWLNKCDITLNHVKQRYAMLAPNPNPIQSESESESNTPAAHTGDIFAGRSFSQAMKDKLTEWLEYKKERRESYKPMGLKSFLTEVENKLKLYNEYDVIALINECMANNWKGIIWDKIKSRASPDGIGHFKAPEENYDHLAINIFAEDFDYEQTKTGG